MPEILPGAQPVLWWWFFDVWYLKTNISNADKDNVIQIFEHKYSNIVKKNISNVDKINVIQIFEHKYSNIVDKYSITVLQAQDGCVIIPPLKEIQILRYLNKNIQMFEEIIQKSFKTN